MYLPEHSQFAFHYGGISTYSGGYTKDENVIQVFTASGTTATLVGSKFEATAYPRSNNYQAVDCLWLPGRGRFVFAWRVYTASNIHNQYMKTVPWSGSAFGSAGNNFTWKTNSETLGAIGTDYNTSTTTSFVGNNVEKFAIYDVDASGTITESSYTTTSSNIISDSSTTTASRPGPGPAGYVLYQTSKETSGQHYMVSSKLSSTTTSGDWVGINTSAASDGGTATITLPGGLNENQSGMTIEGTYYVQDDGDIETGVTSEVAGVAASATQLIVADNTINASQNVGDYASTASVAAKAPLASPALTGTPTAPTAAAGTNSTQIATTAFVTSAGTTYTEITSATTAVAGNVYIVNTGSAVTLTLPASASIGDKVGVIDGTGQAATNNITIGRNSHKIQGDAADMTVSLNRAAFELVYYNATHGWLLTKV